MDIIGKVRRPLLANMCMQSIAILMVSTSEIALLLTGICAVRNVCSMPNAHTLHGLWQQELAG